MNVFQIIHKFESTFTVILGRHFLSHSLNQNIASYAINFSNVNASYRYQHHANFKRYVFISKKYFEFLDAFPSFSFL